MTFTYRWKLSDLDSIPKKNIKVFSTFACGGGSSMGYKMAGLDVIGCLEIDPKINAIYQKNLKPRLNYCEDIRAFNKRKDIPKELFELDILDGSPPCSSFSMAGNREKDWGKKKLFTEGQALQTLDDLFFHYLDTVNLLKPKIFIAENVKGLIQGNAKGYVLKIAEKIKSIGYDFQLFQLNAANMGVPQKRERIFFIGFKKSLNFPLLKLNFYEKGIKIKEALENFKPSNSDWQELRPSLKKYWKIIPYGKSVSSVNDSGSGFCRIKVNPNSIHPTINADLPSMHWKEPRHLGLMEVAILSSFPNDYQFSGIKQGTFLMGMSVPPLMIYKIVKEIERQWSLT